MNLVIAAGFQNVVKKSAALTRMFIKQCIEYVPKILKSHK